MTWEIVVALIVAIPIILLPVAFIWYINCAGIWIVIKDKLTHRKKGLDKTAKV